MTLFPGKTASMQSLLKLIGVCCVAGMFIITASVTAADETESKPAPPEMMAPAVVSLLSDRVISGSEPRTNANFAYLQKLGVKTIISVDGVRPDAETARTFGMRYVHIPIGYDGISRHAQESLTTAVRDTSGQIYIHCHHGRHRGPAAAAIACRIEGSANVAKSLQIMTDAGTSRDYTGLWRDVERFRLPSADSKLPDLVECANVESMAAAMARLSRSFDNLALCRLNEWKTPASHPELDVANEGLQVREELHEAVRTMSEDYNGEFRTWLTESDRLASELHSALKAGNARQGELKFKLLEQSCKKCHARYRN